MEEWDDFRYIDASVSTGSLASSEKSLLTRSSESSSIVDGVQGGTSKKHKSSGLKLDGIELIRLQNGQNSAAAAVKKVKWNLDLIVCSKPVYSFLILQVNIFVGKIRIKVNIFLQN